MRRYQITLNVDVTLPVTFSVIARDLEHAQEQISTQMVAAAASCDTQDIHAWNIGRISATKD